MTIPNGITGQQLQQHRTPVQELHELMNSWNTYSPQCQFIVSTFNYNM